MKINLSGNNDLTNKIDHFLEMQNLKSYKETKRDTLNDSQIKWFEYQIEFLNKLEKISNRFLD